MSSSNASTPVQTPTCDRVRHIQDLVLQCTPGKGRRGLEELQAKLSAALDDEAQHSAGLKHRIVELELDSERPSKRSCGGRNNRTSGVEFEDPSIEPTSIEAAVRLHGRKFVILCGLWLALGCKSAKAFFDTALDDEYNPELRFAADDDAKEEQPRQAQLRELRDIMEPELRAYITQRWFSKAFSDGMCSQLANTRSRLRGPALPAILSGVPDSRASTLNAADPMPKPDIPASHLRTQESRQLHFRERIGYHSAKNKYKVFGVPFLHGNESDTLDFDQIFRHVFLLKVFAAVIDGPNAPEHLLEDRPVHVQAQTMRSKLNVEYTTPGAIAGAAVLVRGHKDFGKVGDLTGINYYDRFGKYLEVILDGLRLRKRWTRELFLLWDTTLFPTLNGSHFGGGVASEAEDEDEELSAARDQLLEMPSVPEIDLDEDDDS
ncbi:hypothetical protein B0H14DRAFT_3483494 [Mycena olivaceomarginata]|nr:hypothetical protein B0H14DRAFT_3483494 [Mycena olivaceomarginata]